MYYLHLKIDSVNLKEQWIIRLDEVKKYIDDNKKLPSRSSKEENIKKLGEWIDHQKTNYKNNTGIISTDKDIKILFEKFLKDYKEYIKIDYLHFKMDSVNLKERWIMRLDELKKYIDDNKKLPSSYYKEENIKQLGGWIGNQKSNYKNNRGIISTDKDIKVLFEKFLKDYKEYIKIN